MGLLGKVQVLSFEFRVQVDIWYALCAKMAGGTPALLTFLYFREAQGDCYKKFLNFYRAARGRLLACTARPITAHHILPVVKVPGGTGEDTCATRPFPGLERAEGTTPGPSLHSIMSNLLATAIPPSFQIIPWYFLC